MKVRQQTVFGVPLVPLRIAPLVGVPAYLNLLLSPYQPVTTGDWVLSLTSAVLVIGGGRWSVQVAVAQSLLVVLAQWTHAFNSSGVVAAFAAVALAEVAMRRWGLVPLLVAGGASAVATVVTLLAVPGPLTSLANALRLVLVVGGPIMLGAHMRSLRELARQYHERALEAELRRASETRQARAEERTAIARELHDLVAHHVASMVLRVNVARHVVSDADDRIREVLDDVHTTGASVLADLRHLVTVLRDPAAVEVPLVEAGDLVTALDGAVRRVRRAGHSARVEVDGAVGTLDAVRRLAVLRVVQESLTNVLKHAGPHAEVRLSVRLDADDVVRIEIEDDGVGTRRARETQPDGHGLVGMRERIDLLGGDLVVGPTGSGWRVHACLPGSRVGAAR